MLRNVVASGIHDKASNQRLANVPSRLENANMATLRYKLTNAM